MMSFLSESLILMDFFVFLQLKTMVNGNDNDTLTLR